MLVKRSLLLVPLVAALAGCVTAPARTCLWKEGDPDALHHAHSDARRVSVREIAERRWVVELSWASSASEPPQIQRLVRDLLEEGAGARRALTKAPVLFFEVADPDEPLSITVKPVAGQLQLF